MKEAFWKVDKFKMDLGFQIEQTPINLFYLKLTPQLL